MIEITEEFVESVNRGEKLVAVAQVVFSELAGDITVWLEQLSKCRILFGKAKLGAG